MNGSIGRILGFSLLILMAGGALPSPVTAAHFPELDTGNTDRFAYYLVDFKIDGVSARPGDEIAIFDPQGVLCGRRVVTPSDEGQLMIITVYGDDTTSPTRDEGAVQGDTLNVKLWQASTGRESAGSDVVLTPGFSPSENFPPSPVPPIWQYRAGYTLNVDTATHFTLPFPVSSYTESVDYIGSLTIRGAPADIGDEVAAYDPQGILCGLFRVHAPGGYGYLHIYGDDTLQTPMVDEGAVEGDPLTFRVWDRSAGLEYAGADVVLGAGSARESFVPSELPPIWSSAVNGYVLDIAVAASSAVPGDLNHNAAVDLADAILALRIVAGYVPALPSIPRFADVNGDGRIGLEEALFIMQKLGGLR